MSDFGDIIRVSVTDTEGKQYGDVDMGGWEIHARRFSAPIREGFHYYGSFAGIDYVGPCNSAEDVWSEILDIRAEIRPTFRDWEGYGSGYGDPEALADEIERASIIASARRLSDSADFDAETSYNGPGRYEGADDKALVVSLDILSCNGCEDESAGSVDETGRYLARFGRYLLAYDSQGFVSAWREDSEEDAKAEIRAEEDRYPAEED